jgi:hypothetical protein
MVWCFDRKGQRLRYEIVRDRRADRYRVTITTPDGSRAVEELREASVVIERSVQFANSLRSKGWRFA